MSTTRREFLERTGRLAAAAALGPAALGRALAQDGAKGAAHEGKWFLSFGVYAVEDDRFSTCFNVSNPILAENLTQAGEKEFGLEVIGWDGQLVAKTELAKIASCASRRIALRPLLEKAKVKLPFEGHVVIRTRPATEAGSRADMGFQACSTDWFAREQGGAATSHILRDFVRQENEGPRPDGSPYSQQVFPVVYEDGLNATRVVVQNLTPRTEGAKARPRIILWNHEGKFRAASLDEVPPRGARSVRLRELWPDADKFLAGQAGWIELHDEARPLGAVCFVEGVNGSLAADHLFDRDFTSHRKHGSNAYAGIVKEAHGVSTWFHVLNPYEESPQDVRIRVFAQDGRLVGEQTQLVNPNSAWRVPLLGFLAGKGDLKPPFFGSAIINSKPRAGQRASGLQSIQIEFRSDTQRSFMHPLTGFGNIGGDARYSDQVIQRVLADERYETYLALQHAGSHRGVNKPIAPLLVLHDAAGKPLEKQLEAITPLQSRHFALSAVLPNAREHLAGAHGTLSVRDGCSAKDEIELLLFVKVLDKKTGAVMPLHALDRDYDFPYGG